MADVHPFFLNYIGSFMLLWCVFYGNFFNYELWLQYFSGREIPTLNIDLHVVHCFRNLEKCTICGTMIPKKHAEEHYMDEHAPVSLIRELLQPHCSEIINSSCNKSYCLQTMHFCPIYNFIISCLWYWDLRLHLGFVVGR